MKVIKFDFQFTHAGSKFNASCQAAQTYSANYPTYRVAVVNKNGNDPDVYILYKVDWPEKVFEWHELKGMKQPMAKSIAKALTKYIALHPHSLQGRDAVRRQWKKSHIA